jgi:hypothetical protein
VWVLACWECRFEMFSPLNACVVARTICYSSVVVVFIAYVVVTWCVWVGRVDYVCGYVFIRASKWDYVFLYV